MTRRTFPYTPLHASFQEILAKKRLLPEKARLLIALSGGQDSLCLGQLLLDFQPRRGWEMAIAHCDHRWSRDVGLSEQVRSIADRWNLPFFLQIAPPLPETEGTAREWRYGALTEIARREGFSHLVTGHTKSDRAETFLYHLARGAGVGGLASLTWRRQLTDDLLLVRPLLNVSRSETRAFCESRQLPIHDDPANEDLRYKRNRVRQELIPYLQANLNPRIEEHLWQTATILEAENDYLEGIARGIFEKAIDRENRRLDRMALRSLPLALQRRVIRRFLGEYLPSSPNFTEIEAVVSIIDAPNRTRTPSLSGRISVQARDNWLEFLR